ncbi:deoxycytidylate deaminase [Acinetobacter baumannii]|uniref:deoxycytidylate deaminase n=2 Tax=Acinetobacter baumannii TaxID=470 RepID=UPI0007083C41|nr:deoxycytidylate deaminase [Acinetobacter baumannii]KQF79084.1 deoxycytidylate deaminase [Acinetobacter baumannii]
MDKKRYSILRNYANANHTQFRLLKVSELISAHLLNTESQIFIEFIKNVVSEDLKSQVEEVLDKSNFLKFQEEIKDLDANNYFLKEDSELIKGETSYEKWLELVKKFTETIKDIFKNTLRNSYVEIYQAAGDSIRRTGTVTPNPDDVPFNLGGLHVLPAMINKIIKYYRWVDKVYGQKTYIVIDAIRNPYEAKYFKDRYSAFYLISINAPNEDRRKYLQEKFKFTIDQIEQMDKKESGELVRNSEEDANCTTCGSKKTHPKDPYHELITSNVKHCIEISDIHIFNPRNEPTNHNVLKAQLAWYISLMKHPGLTTPTSLERVMQIAYTAKMNSGCISRQVGAVVTDEDYSIKAVGWNDVAKGQVPCGLRSLQELDEFSSETDYSLYERTSEKFREEAGKQLIKLKNIGNNGRHLAYCFKSIQNKVEGEKNQVHTRSLHAEENAFLQLAKYGGIGINGGKLFTTASPCELCAKKAYQLGIKEIVYIDPYPGIAMTHILAIGVNPPTLTQFRGAVGRAYHQLYEPLMPYKDELGYLQIIS